MQRAQPLRVRWPIHWFPNGPHSGSHLAHVSTSPPAIPDGVIVGIEMWRAQHPRVRWPLHRFPNGPQSGSHNAHGSTSPPFHPGRSDFPSPVGDHGFHLQPSQCATWAQVLTHVVAARIAPPSRTAPPGGTIRDDARQLQRFSAKPCRGDNPSGNTGYACSGSAGSRCAARLGVGHQ